MRILIIKVFTIIAFLASSRISLYGQIFKLPVDTVNIFKNKTGIPYRIYKRIWFPQTGSFSYRLSKVNKQDSIVLYADSLKTYYFKVYNSCHKLILEGTQKHNYQEFSGVVIFYRRNGNLEKTEEWKSEYYKDTMNMRFEYGDGSKNVRSTYFKRNGKVKKIVLFTIQLNSLEPLNITWIYATNYYSKNGRIKRTKQKRA